MQLKLTPFNILFLFFIVSSNCTSAISNSNGEGINASIFGAFINPESSIVKDAIYYDVAVNTTGYDKTVPEEFAYIVKGVMGIAPESIPGPEYREWRAQLIDDNDIYYDELSEMSENQLPHGRNILGFKIPQVATPKKLKISPIDAAFSGDAEKFRMNWTPIYLNLSNVDVYVYPNFWRQHGGYMMASENFENDPEINLPPLALKLYDLYQIYDDSSYSTMVWVLDTKIKNNGTERLEIYPTSLIKRDQFGWKYEASEFDSPPLDENPDKTRWDLRNTKQEKRLQLLPGEARRIGVVFKDVSVLSQFDKNIEYVNTGYVV